MEHHVHNWTEKRDPALSTKDSDNDYVRSVLLQLHHDRGELTTTITPKYHNIKSKTKYHKNKNNMNNLSSSFSCSSFDSTSSLNPSSSPPSSLRPALLLRNIRLTSLPTLPRSLDRRGRGDSNSQTDALEAALAVVEGGVSFRSTTRRTKRKYQGGGGAPRQWWMIQYQLLEHTTHNNAPLISTFKSTLKLH